ncbi:geranylgeranylglyceryl/heptaprenylglyceryl phosphate synthase [Ascidiimonas sp. W6]|uniref:geranylgeranylglyceryl/heptaprenylglyceryl phosphate synthase n=1 Tax=Ascidiimonas meishanensis TaxID=3128903 RepID=UPI0030EE881F
MKNQVGFTYQHLLASLKQREKLLAVLLDPEDFVLATAQKSINQINQSPATHIFVGGSTVKIGATYKLVQQIRPLTSLPILIFPSDEQQIASNADALLFLMLLSGRNPEYLIEKQVRSAAILRKQPMDTISTGYILIDGGTTTTVQKVSHTTPISMNDLSLITDTAFAGELLGNKLIYLEAGSGAMIPINAKVIASVKKSISIPLIVGGGIRSLEDINRAYDAGADMVVIGTAFEKDITFFQAINHSILP